MITREELIKEWVKALRSGDYQQGKSYLHNADDDTYCCLGVACDILRRRGDLYGEDETDTRYVGVDVGGNPTYKFYTVTNYFGEDASWGNSTQLLPEAVSELLGLVYHGTEGDRKFVDNPVFTVTVPGQDEKGTYPVSSLNDTYGFTFAQIADLIEEQGIRGE